MLQNPTAFSGFSVNSIAEAKEFYSNVLGLAVTEIPEGLQLHIGNGANVFVYEKPNHVPATFTVLNVQVTAIEDAVKDLSESGVVFERYEGMEQDELGISHQGKRSISWFKDPAGNIFSLIQE